MTRNTDLTDPNVVKAIAHPLRVRILGILDQRTATPRQIAEEIWGRVPRIVKEALVGATLGQLGEQATASAAAGGFSRTQAHLDRTVVMLDERGLDAVSAELVKLLERVDRIQEASAKRLERAGHEAEIRMTLGLMFFDQVEVAEGDAQPGERRRRSSSGRKGRPRSARS